MKANFIWDTIVGAILSLAFAALVFCQPQESPYRVAPIYTPPLQRPALQTIPQALPEGTTGALPTFDGEPFHLNFRPRESGELTPEQVRERLNPVLQAIQWQRPADELRFVRRTTNPGAQNDYMERQLKEGVEQTRRRLQGRFSQLNKATNDALQEEADALRRQAQQRSEVFLFDQFFKDVPFDHTGLRAVWRSGVGLVAVDGRVFNEVNLTNSAKLDSNSARRFAIEHVKKSTNVLEEPRPHPVLVILPYGEGLRYTWRMDVTAEEGPYRLWIDAQDGQVLQLEPQFFFDSARGLVFNPNPNVGTVEKGFEVDPPVDKQYRLRLSGVLDVNNSGADGICSGDVTISSEGTTEANFNVAPINGTVVDRTSSMNYNCRFQEVNVYAWIYTYRQAYLFLGSQPFGMITATVNHNNPCGFGINNACSTPTFGVGQATISASTSCNDIFNTAIDATLIAHEFGHILNGNQYAAAGGTMTGSINEGLSDFWAYTMHNTNTFAAYVGTNCGAPRQDSWFPRQAETLDVFPEHRSLGSGLHADGQMVAWALWNSRDELQQASDLGVFSINFNMIRATSTAGVGVFTGTSDRRVHDAYLNLLQQLAPLYGTSRSLHKILSGFARAGLFLSPREAVIDINDDYLDRDNATGPTFTIWTGRDYDFNVNETVNTGNQPFNTRFTIEVANDEAFTQNLVSSGQLGGVVAAAGGTASWALPAGDWNTLRVADQLFYRVTTTDNAGGNVRISSSPGGGFLTNVPAGRAIINQSGECECTCAVATSASAGTAAITLLPILIAMFWRRQIRIAERNLRAAANC